MTRTTSSNGDRAAARSAAPRPRCAADRSSPPAAPAAPMGSRQPRRVLASEPAGPDPGTEPRAGQPKPPRQVARTWRTGIRGVIEEALGAGAEGREEPDTAPAEATRYEAEHHGTRSVKPLQIVDDHASTVRRRPPAAAARPPRWTRRASRPVDRHRVPMPPTARDGGRHLALQVPQAQARAPGGVPRTRHRPRTPRRPHAEPG